MFADQVIGSDVSLVQSGPHVESSHSESPSLVAPPPPVKPSWDPNGEGAAPLNASSALSPASPKVVPKPQTLPPKGELPSKPGSSNGSSPGRLTSGLEGASDATVLEEVAQPAVAEADANPKPAALDVGQSQNHQTRDSKVLPVPSPIPTLEVYEVPSPNEPKPKLSKTAPGVPMAMVHSEAALDGPHTMKPGDSILTVGVDPFASNLVLGMGLGPVSPATQRVMPTRISPAVQGATFAAGGTTYTASIDRDFNIVVGSSILKPGGAAATLAGGAAKVSVVPGGALVVDGGTLTMSALHPPVTGCVVNINGRLVTARETGTDHKVMILSTATLTVGGLAVTLDGQMVSLGPLGLHLGPSVAAVSTMTPSWSSATITPSPSVSFEWVSGLARMSRSSSGSAKPTVTYITIKTGAGNRRFLSGNNLALSLALVLGMFFAGG
jgi:hypothetical protein